MKTHTKFLSHIFLIIITFLPFSLNAQAVDYWKTGTSFNERIFSGIFGRARTTALAKDGKKIDDGASAGSWTAQIKCSRYMSESIEYRMLPCLVNNNGTNFEYMFNTEPLSEYIKEKSLASITKKKEELIEEYEDLKIELSVDEENKLLIFATFSYANEPSANDIENRLAHLMKMSERIGSDIMVNNYSMWVEYHDELLEREYTYITKNEFIPLTNYGLQNFEDEDPLADEGDFSFTIEEMYNFTIYNYGDSISYSMWIDAPENLDENIINEILTEMKEEVSSNPFENSKYTSILIYEDYPTTFFLETAYDISSSKEGEQIVENFNEFIKEYAQEIGDELIDKFEDHE